MAGALKSLGVGPGDRVVGLALNNDRYFELFLAVPRAGGVIVPLNTRWSEAELLQAVEDCEPVLLAVDDALLPMARTLVARRPGLRLVHIGEDKVEGGLHYDDLEMRSSPVEDSGRSGDDLFGIFYTGGTTGRSKGVMLSHRNVLHGAAIAHIEGYYREDAIYLMAAPLYHASGSWPLISLTASGGTAVILPAFEAEAALVSIATHGVTESLLVPTMIQMMMDHHSFPHTEISSLRTIVYGASPITGALLDRALAVFVGVEFVQAYGMTELSPVAAGLPHKCLLGDYRKRGVNRAAGRVCSGLEIRIVDEDDNEVQNGTVGEICVRGDSVMLGYWRQPEETEKTLRNGWMHTGDGGRLDDEGFMYIADRVKDMIVSGGENIYSIEVENALALHPSVRQCVVIGIPSERWVEQVHALVILREGADTTEAELIQHVRTLLAGYKVPRSIEFRTEPFPLSPANKILKRELRATYWVGRDSSVA